MSIHDAPEFDAKKPFNTCYGDAKEKYSQNGFYYDTHFNPVSKLPDQPRKVVVNAHRAKTERVQEAIAAHEAVVSLPTELPKVVKGAKSPLLSLSAARQENAAAAAAEQHAED